MGKISAAISFNLDEHLVAAALPLFEAEKVGAIEWSFDCLYQAGEVPQWFTEMLHTYGDAERLVGHGVYYSLFSGGWSSEQQEWLKQLRSLATTFRFDHISEHFGFMTSGNFHQGAPLGIPFTATTLAIGRDRLKRLYHACECPVGLENLAFSYTADEVKHHGQFLDELVAPINGFIILDLHNIYCQAANFNLPATQILRGYPLHRVREIHISGGSWEMSSAVSGKQIRRDTHDSTVPNAVFELLKAAIPSCPSLKYVVLEQLSLGLQSAQVQADFRADFNTMQSIIATFSDENQTALNRFLPADFIAPSDPLVDAQLQHEQAILSAILEHAVDYHDARDQLLKSPLAGSSWQVERWEPFMLETAVAIATKWKLGFK